MGVLEDGERLMAKLRDNERQRRQQKFVRERDFVTVEVKLKHGSIQSKGISRAVMRSLGFDV
jgi:hypothetical protein